MAISISICGSMSFMDEMEAIASSLAALGCEAMTPIREERNFDWSNLADADLVALKKSFIDRHLAKIRRSDAVLIANFPKHNIDGYVGPNTLMEAAFAHALSVPIIFLFDPSQQACGLECVSISCGCVNGEATEVLPLLREIRPGGSSLMAH